MTTAFFLIMTLAIANFTGLVLLAILYRKVIYKKWFNRYMAVSGVLAIVVILIFNILQFVAR